MSDALFELRLERAARRIADEGVRPIDAVAVSQAAIRAAGRAEELAPRRFGWPLDWRPFAVAALAVVLVVSASLVIDRLREDVGQPSQTIVPSPTPSPSASPGTGGGDEVLAGKWLADLPPGLTFAENEPASRMALNVFSGPSASISLVGGGFGLLRSSFDTFNVGEVRLTTTSVGEDGVTLDGSHLTDCKIGDEGRYQSTSTTDSLLLTLELISEDCPARAAVFARTWVRSLAVPNGGGVGVVDAFDPLLIVALPAGNYTVDRSVDAVTIHQELPELQFLSFKDPQGFLDPCDRSKGRDEIEPGADAVVAYFQQLAGFTVDAVEETTIDGFRAVHLVVHADEDASCPDGRLWEWQPKAQTGDLAWFVTPGITDSLILVEHPKGTLMFELLPAPNTLEQEVMSSIRFLDELPTSP